MFRFVAALWTVLFASSVHADGFAEVSLANVHSLSVNGGVSVVVTLHASPAIEARAINGDIARLIVTQTDGTIFISRDFRNIPVDQEEEDAFEVTLSLPQINRISAKTGGEVRIINIFDYVFVAHAETGGLIFLPNIVVDNLHLTAETGGYIRADGECAQAEFSAVTGAHVIADHLNCVDVHGVAKRSGTLRMFASKTAMVDAETGSTVVLSGGAEVTSERISTSATVRVW